MAKLNRQQIQARAIELLEEANGGMRWSAILKAVEATTPETPHNSVHGAVHALLNSRPDEIVKVARGTYQLAKYYESEASVTIASESFAESQPVKVEGPKHTTVTLLESDFYDSFAAWLIDGAEEANEAEALGGSILKGKWGTPDVIGVLKPRADDILKFQPQIVSAEIKIDPNQPVIAFGQAIAYRLFSHKSYIVMPESLSEDDLGRLKALCSIHGVGLVTFKLDKEAPDYVIVVPAQQASPDMFYANQMVRRLRDSAPKIFHKFFS